MAKRQPDEGDSGILRGDDDGTQDMRQSDGDTVAVADDDLDNSTDTTDDESSSEESLDSGGGSADQAASSAESTSETPWSARTWAQANGFEGDSDENIFKNIGQAAVRWQQHAYQQQSRMEELQQKFDQLSAAQKTAAPEQAEEFKWDKTLPEYSSQWNMAKDAEGHWLDPSIPVKLASHNEAFLTNARELLNSPHKFLEPVFGHYQKQFLSEAEKRMEERWGEFERRYQADQYLLQNGQRFFDQQTGQLSQEGSLFRDFVAQGKEMSVPPGKALQQWADVHTTAARLNYENEQLRQALAQYTGEKKQKQNGAANNGAGPGAANGNARDASTGQFVPKSKAERAEEKRQQLLERNSRRPGRNGTEGRGDTEQNEDLDIYARLRNQLRAARG